MPTGQLPEFNDGPPIVCSTWLTSGVTLLVMRIFSEDPVMKPLFRLVKLPAVVVRREEGLGAGNVHGR